LDRLAFLQVPPESIFAHPDVPVECRFVQYLPDGGDPEHFTDRWDIFDVTGYTQWYDGMCTYARRRKVKGREPSYTLDDILILEVGAGKSEFSEYKTHYDMQTYDFPNYVGYNGIDNIGPMIMEELINDAIGILKTVEESDYRNYAHQTTQLVHGFYRYLQAKGMVPASTGRGVPPEWDKELQQVGGAVLDPDLLDDVGAKVLDQVEMLTLLLRCVMDIDVQGEYPNLTISRNISTQTKRAMLLHIIRADGTQIDVNELCELLIDMAENAVQIGTTLFQLPSYTEMHARIRQRLNGGDQPPA
jgi:hypothetical protein